jgi:hypothetical protein
MVKFYLKQFQQKILKIEELQFLFFLTIKIKNEIVSIKIIQFLLQFLN